MIRVYIICYDYNVTHWNFIYTFTCGYNKHELRYFTLQFISSWVGRSAKSSNSCMIPIYFCYRLRALLSPLVTYNTVPLSSRWIKLNRVIHFFRSVDYFSSKYPLSLITNHASRTIIFLKLLTLFWIIHITKLYNLFSSVVSYSSCDNRLIY